MKSISKILVMIFTLTMLMTVIALPASAEIDFTVKDMDGNVVEPSADTYTVDDDIHVYGDFYTCSGNVPCDIYLEDTAFNTTFQDLTSGSVYIEIAEDCYCTLMLENTLIKGEVEIETASDECMSTIYFDGTNEIKETVSSTAEILFYGEDGGILLLKNCQTATCFDLETIKISNVQEDYLNDASIKTLTPVDSTKPILLQQKKCVEFPSEWDEEALNNGKPFACGKVEFDIPQMTDEDGNVLDPQPEVKLVYFIDTSDSSDGSFGMKILEEKPTAPGKYYAIFEVLPSNPEYHGMGIFPFTIAHDIQKVAGKAPTKTEAGYKEYYACVGCKDAFEDAEGKVEIKDIDSWKAKGGAGYLAPLGTKEDTKKSEPSGKKSPETGDPMSAVASMLVAGLAMATISLRAGKKK